MKKWIFGFLVSCFVVPPASANVSVAMVEFHNLSGEALPRVGSYTENALNRFFSRDPHLDVSSRTAVSEMLIRRRDSVVLFPGNAELTASFARDLGVEYVLTGTILEYGARDGLHEMTVDLVVIGAHERKRVFRKIYSGNYHDRSGYKKHREILDQIIEDLSVDFSSVVLGAKQRREEEIRRKQEEERRRQAELERERQRAETVTEVIQITNKLTQVEDDVHFVVRFVDVELLKNTWGGAADGDAELELTAFVAQTNGNSDGYAFPADGPATLGLGERLAVGDSGFLVKLPKGADRVTVHYTGHDQDTASVPLSLFMGSVMDLLATGVGFLVQPRIGKPAATFLTWGLKEGGDLVRRYLEESDVIGEGTIVLADTAESIGGVRTVTTTNGAMRLRYTVSKARVA